MDEVAIKVEHVSKTFKLPHEKNASLKGKLINFKKRGFETQEVLRNISFEIKKGEFFGIVGRNGSGKSTLLKMLAGIYTPTSGSIQVNGKLTPFIELGVGFNPELTGRENVFLNGALLGFSRKEMAEMYDSIVEFAELKKFMDQKLKNYSSGMQVRLAFAIAIRANTDILVLDEVLAVGDAAFQEKCFNYFERLKKEKKTIVLVTHDMSAVKRFCNRAMLIENGKIKVAGTPDDVANQYLFDNLNFDKKQGKKTSEELTPDIDQLTVSMISSPKLNSDDILEFDVEYVLHTPLDVYLGFSVMHHGVSIMEHNSKEIMIGSKAGTKHKVRYSMPVDGFNTDSFTLNITIFNKDNGTVLGYKVDAIKFFVESGDLTRTKGGPMKTTGVWKHEK